MEEKLTLAQMLLNGEEAQRVHDIIVNKEECIKARK